MANLVLQSGKDDNVSWLQTFWGTKRPQIYSINSVIQLIMIYNQI